MTNNMNLVTALTSGPGAKMNQPMMSVGMPVSAGGDMNTINTMNNGAMQPRPMGSMPMNMPGQQGQMRGNQMMIGNRPNMIMQAPFLAQGGPPGGPRMMQRMPQVRMAGPQNAVMTTGQQQQFPGGAAPVMGGPQQRMPVQQGIAGMQPQPQGGPVNLPPRYPTKMDGTPGNAAGNAAPGGPVVNAAGGNIVQVSQANQVIPNMGGGGPNQPQQAMHQAGELFTIFKRSLKLKQIQRASFFPMKMQKYLQKEVNDSPTVGEKNIGLISSYSIFLHSVCNFPAFLIFVLRIFT